MDFDHALHVFKLYCRQLKQDPSGADSMLLTESEREAIQEIGDLIREYADLFVGDRLAAPGKTVCSIWQSGRRIGQGN